MKHRFLPLLVALTAALGALPAHAVELAEIARQAIANGDKAGGILTGPTASMIGARTGSKASPFAVAEVIGSFQDPTCKRLRLTIMQTEVPMKDGTKRALRLPPFEMSLCANGLPPGEVVTDAVKAAAAKASVTRGEGR